MDGSLRQIIRKVTPRPLSRAFWKVTFSLQPQLLFMTTKLTFRLARTEPIWLDYSMLERYHQKYQKEYQALPSYGYDPTSREKRGIEKANNIMNLIPAGNTFLELGCGDGMACYGLQRLGKTTVAIDIWSKGFDERAINAGVRFYQMDASYLSFKDESFDAVFSYDAFEHFPKPETVLKEAIRVVKPGGYIYLKFGHLYMSALGAHLYRQIMVPYCHLLFPKDSLNTFADSRNLGYLNFDQLNGYTVEDFRRIWLSQLHKLRRIRYHESRNISHLDLIAKHPTCFKSKTNSFDDLTIGSIVVLFQKKI
jgi:ubiquinone/menaquinone biosynthesis C-methylase UbiE